MRKQISLNCKISMPPFYKNYFNISIFIADSINLPLAKNPKL
ncbi:hypothetical protein P20311_3199 [Pseudoalteromonas sp. BSi20311]|nr:hypothetical protein P20311_3199 [Pseudoalteromonas sp. BSi20311]GAA71444.1 hypothetical protein P20439_1518 [Pseudoalteromonas sp. BSi20439]